MGGEQWGSNPPGSGQPGAPLYNGGSAEMSPPCALDMPPPSFVTGEPTTENCTPLGYRGPLDLRLHITCDNH